MNWYLSEFMQEKEVHDGQENQPATASDQEDDKSQPDSQLDSQPQVENQINGNDVADTKGGVQVFILSN